MLCRSRYKNPRNRRKVGGVSPTVSLYKGALPEFRIGDEAKVCISMDNGWERIDYKEYNGKSCKVLGIDCEEPMYKVEVCGVTLDLCSSEVKKGR